MTCSGKRAITGKTKNQDVFREIGQNFPGQPFLVQSFFETKNCPAAGQARSNLEGPVRRVLLRMPFLISRKTFWARFASPKGVAAENAPPPVKE